MYADVYALSPAPDHQTPPNPPPPPVLQYEQELTLLTQQLAETQTMLAETQTRLNSEEQARGRLHQDWQSQLDHSEEKMKIQQQEKDQQMKSIIQRCVNLRE